MQTSPESKWTKGPWSVGMESGHNASTVFAAGDIGVAQVYGIPLHCTLREVSARHAEGVANAHLIASAPDMAEALEAAPIRSKYHGVNGFEEARFFEDYDAFMAKRRAALSKAGGR